MKINRSDANFRVEKASATDDYPGTRIDTQGEPD
jgi:hypothetical protein